MSEPVQNTNAKRSPQMTALSTAYPMQFESEGPKPAATPERIVGTDAPIAREPHRHDAGE
jgi:hypothetical protein